MFLLRPEAFPGESLSSWRQRAGEANGFLRFPRPVGVRNTKDPDRVPAPPELDWLCREFRLDGDSIWQRCVECVGATVSRDFALSTKPSWLIPLTAHRSKQYGSSYCAECLCNDAQPYYRVAWRFAFVVSCPEHGTLLRDRCPTCARPAWPSWLRVISDWRYVQLHRCPHCGQDLRQEQGRLVDSSPFVELWDCATNRVLPSITPKCSSPTDVFGGLRALCLLLLRRSSASVYPFIPPLSGATQEEVLRGTLGSAIENMPVDTRSTVIAAAYWLLKDWPRRFVEVARRGGLSKQNFVPTQIAYPPWMAHAIYTSLSLRTTGITRQQVERAVSDIRAAGDVVSKSAVRRKLRVSESAAIDDLLSQRRHGTEQELAMVCGAFERRLAGAPSSKNQRAAHLRDYLIFLLSVLSEQKLESVCEWSHEDVCTFMERARCLARTRPGLTAALVTRVEELQQSYASWTRPKFANCSRPAEGWFLARQGMRVEAHSVRGRVSAAMGATLSPALWRSADVFLQTLRGSAVP